MATTTQSVTADELVSATVKYSNKDDDSRIYDISANVNIQNGNVNSFDNGQVRKSQQGNMGMESYVGNFSSYGDHSISININNATPEEAKAIFTSVYDFMADVRVIVSANPVTA